MEVILLQRIGSLGQMGDIVTVKNGYARNYLLPQKKAMRATKENKAFFETQRTHLEADNLEQKTEADAVAQKLIGKVFIAIRQAGDTGQLYGSVSSRDIAEVVTEDGFTVTRGQIILARPIKTLGLHPVTIALHPEVAAEVQVNVARSADEAERQARGEDVLVIQDEEIKLETFDPDADERSPDDHAKADADGAPTEDAPGGDEAPGAKETPDA